MIFVPLSSPLGSACSRCLNASGYVWPRVWRVGVRGCSLRLRGARPTSAAYRRRIKATAGRPAAFCAADHRKHGSARSTLSISDVVGSRLRPGGRRRPLCRPRDLPQPQRRSSRRLLRPHRHPLGLGHLLRLGPQLHRGGRRGVRAARRLHSRCHPLSTPYETQRRVTYLFEKNDNNKFVCQFLLVSF